MSVVNASGSILPRIPNETATAHTTRTGHAMFEWNLDKDVETFERIFGRPPNESDPYVGVLVCRRCSTWCFNR